MKGKRGRTSFNGAAMIVVAVVVLAGLAMVAFWPDRRDSPATAPPAAGYQRHPTASPRPDTKLPPYALKSPEVRQLYSFALRRPDLLTYIPCTCGCASDGHHSNWNCYIRSIAADGTVTFDGMAPG
jgi:hypothetical protein